MEAIRVDRGGSLRVETLCFAKGEEVLATLGAYAQREGITSASFVGLGAFRVATLAFFNRETRVYDPIPVEEQVELLNITGNITLFEGEPRLHAHATLSYPDGRTIGGHLIEGTVWPTLELTLTITEVPVHRQLDEETGLPLIGDGTPG